MECCEVCRFEWDAIESGELPVRLRSAAAGFRDVLASCDPIVAHHHEPEVWSLLEYSGHVRDVLFNLRDRIVLGLAEDNPVPKAMFAQVRIDSGLYAADDAATLASEIGVAAGLLARTTEALGEAQLDRPIFYGWPVPATRTLLWVAAQALHEAEHHLADARRLAAG